MESADIDAVDMAILYQLQEDGRRSFTDIADAVDVSPNTVRNRVQELEDRGVIEGYQANVNYDEAGIHHYWVFVCSARVSKREELAAEARQHANVVEVVTLMTGESNVLVVGAGQEKDDMTDLAYDIDELGLAIERELLVRAHDRRPFSGFRLEENL